MCVCGATRGRVGSRRGITRSARCRRPRRSCAGRPCPPSSARRGSSQQVERGWRRRRRWRARSCRGRGGGCAFTAWCTRLLLIYCCLLACCVHVACLLATVLLLVHVLAVLRYQHDRHDRHATRALSCWPWQAVAAMAAALRCDRRTCGRKVSALETCSCTFPASDLPCAVPAYGDWPSQCRDAARRDATLTQRTGRTVQHAL